MKRNKGFTLIELIVVIGILAIVLGVGGLSLSSLLNANADAYAEEISILLTEARFKHMGYADHFYVTITYEDSEKVYMVELNREYDDLGVLKKEVVKSTKIGKGFQVSYKKNGDDSVVDIKDLENHRLTVKFASSGAIDENAGALYVSKGSSSKTKEIVMNMLTGKVVVSDANK